MAAARSTTCSILIPRFAPQLYVRFNPDASLARPRPPRGGPACLPQLCVLSRHASLLPSPRTAVPCVTTAIACSPSSAIRRGNYLVSGSFPASVRQSQAINSKVATDRHAASAERQRGSRNVRTLNSLLAKLVNFPRHDTIGRNMTRCNATRYDVS